MSVWQFRVTCARARKWRVVVPSFLPFMLTVTGIYLFQTCNYELSFRAFPFIRGFVALKQVKQTAFVLSCSQAMGKQQRDSSPHLTAFFRYFGGFCSRYPVEVFVAWLTTFACFLTLGLSGHSFIPNFRHFDGKEVSILKVLIALSI